LIQYELLGCTTGVTVCPVVGATVDFVLGGVTVFSGTTNSIGRTTYNNPSPGAYTINWSVPNTGFSGTASITISSACESRALTHTITADNVTTVCFAGCAVPIPEPALFITDGAGTRLLSACVVFGGAAIQTVLISNGTACGAPNWTVRYSEKAGSPCPFTFLSGSVSDHPATGGCARPLLLSGTHAVYGAFTVHE
jgi:hypothetical protein